MDTFITPPRVKRRRSRQKAWALLVVVGWCKVVQDLRTTDEDEKVPRFFCGHILRIQSAPKQKDKFKTKTDGPMEYNWRQFKMKKVLLTMVVLVGMTAGAMTLSAFTTPKQEAKTECSQNKMNADNWKLFREGVAYCDGDTGTCVGTGDVWVNTETYQIRFRKSATNYDLTEYTGKDGYNMRFWDGGAKKYYYVYIYIPAAAFN